MSACSPGTTTLTAIADTWIDKTDADEDLGDDSNLKVRPTGGWDFRTLIQFELASIPDGCSADSASLKLYQKDEKSQTIEIYRLTEPWIEGEVTWDTAPPYDSSPWASFDGGVQAPVVRTISIDSLVQSWIDGTNPNYGLMLMATSGSGSIQFSSRETADPPQLVVSYGP